MRHTASFVLIAATLILQCLPIRECLAQAWQVRPGDELSMDIEVDGSGDAIVVASGYYFAVSKLAGATGEQIWRLNLLGTEVGGFNEPTAAALDANDDVLVAGRIKNTDTFWDFTVVKVAGADGTEIWRSSLNGTANGFDTAWAVGADSAGNVIAGGSLANLEGPVFTVVKLSGVDGSELWRYSIPSTPGNFGVATAVAVDAFGGVVAAGSTTNALTVVRLSGEAGLPLWRYDTLGQAGAGRAMALDGSGDVLAVGSTPAGLTPEGYAPLNLTVVKLSGLTGTELWRADVDGPHQSDDRGRAVTVDSQGNAVAVGDVLDSSLHTADFLIAKFAAADGAELWRRILEGSPGHDRGYDVAVDASGDVVAAGDINRCSPTQCSDVADGFAVMKLAGASGDEIWRRALRGDETSSYDVAMAVTVGSSGDAFASGVLDRLSGVLKLSGAAGGDFLLSGAQLRIKEKDGNAEKRRVKVASRDRGVSVPALGAPGDPTTADGMLQLLNPTTGESASFPLPASKWRALGGSRGYRYEDPARAAGACKRILLRSRRLKAACAGARVDFSFDEAAQVSLGVSLTSGTGALRQCMVFAPPSVVRDEPGSFKAKKAQAPEACP